MTQYGARTDTSSEKNSTTEFKRPRLSPIHHRAIGLLAIIGTESQIALSQIVEACLPELYLQEGVKLESDENDSIFKIRQDHKITIVPVTQVGAIMYKSMKVPSQSPYTKSALKIFKPELQKHLRPFKNLTGEAQLTGVDWIGSNQNVLVANIDTNSEIYHQIEQAQQAFIESLAKVGLLGVEFCQPNHITLLRAGSKKHPYSLKEETKSLAKDLLYPRVVNDLGSVTVLGLTLKAANHQYIELNTTDNKEPLDFSKIFTAVFEI